MGINEDWIARQEASDEARRLHERDRLAVWTMDALAGLMEDNGISKAQLARKIGTSRSYTTQIFSGVKNPTLNTIADLAWALGFRACVKFEPLRSKEFMSVPVQSCKLLTLPKPRVVSSVRRVQDLSGGTADFSQPLAMGVSK